MKLLVLNFLVVCSLVTEGNHGENMNYNFVPTYDHSTTGWMQRNVRHDDKNPNAIHQRAVASSPLIPNRSKRDTSDFDSVVDQLSLSARLIAGISLEVGLIEGNIDGDKAIAELLNIESVDMSKLEEFKKKDVTNFYEKLKGLNLKDTADTKHLERIMKILNSWHTRFTNIGLLDDAKISDPFFDKLDELKKTSIDIDVPKNVFNAIQEVEKAWVALTPFISPDAFQNKTVEIQQLNNIDILGKNLNQLIVNWENITSALSTLRSYEPVVHGSISIDKRHTDLLELFADYLNEKRDVDITTTNENEDIAKNIELLKEVSTVFMQATQAVSEIFEIAHSRSAKPSGIRSLTSGFPNGFSDFLKLSSDAHDFWLKSEGLTSLLTLGLAPLKIISDRSPMLSPDWISIASESNKKVVNRVSRIHSQFASSQKVFQDPRAAITSLTGSFVKPQGNKTYLEEAEKVLRNAHELRKRLKSVFMPSETVLSSINDTFLNKIKKFKSFTDNVTPQKLDTEIPIALKAFHAFEDRDNIIKELRRMKDILKSIHEVLRENSTPIAVDNINTLLDKVVGGKGTISKLAELPENMEIIDFFRSFQNRAENLYTLAECVHLIDEVRDIKTDLTFSSELDSVAGTVEKSIPLVKNLRGAPEEIKNSASKEEVKKLMQLKDIQTESKTFGTAVALLQNIREVYSHKAEFAQLKENLEVVREKLNDLKTNERDFTRKLKVQWGDFSLEKAEKMLVVLETKIGSFQKPADISSFSNFTSVFSNFQGINFVDIDLKSLERLEVLDQLIKKFPAEQKLASVRNSLQKVSELNLRFASHSTSLTEVTESLENIDSAFSSFRKPVGTVTPTTESFSPHTASTLGAVDYPKTEVATTEGSFLTTGAIVWIIVVVAFLIFASGLGLYFGVFKKKKEKKNGGHNDPENFPTSTNTATNSKNSRDSQTSKDSTETKESKLPSNAAVVSSNKEISARDVTNPPVEEDLACITDHPLNIPEEAPDPNPDPEGDINTPFKYGTLAPKKDEKSKVLIRISFTRPVSTYGIPIGRIAYVINILDGAHNKPPVGKMYHNKKDAERHVLDHLMSFAYNVATVKPEDIEEAIKAGMSVPKTQYTGFFRQDFAKICRKENSLIPNVWHRNKDRCLTGTHWYYKIHANVIMMPTTGVTKIVSENPVTYLAEHSIVHKKNILEDSILFENFVDSMGIWTDEKVEAVVAIYNEAEANDYCSGLDIFLGLGADKIFNAKQPDTHIFCMNQAPLPSTDGRVLLRKLCVHVDRIPRDPNKRSDRIVYLVMIKGWAQGGLPQFHQDVRSALKLTKNRKTVVYSMNGTGRACVFVGIQWFAEMIMTGQHKIPLDEILYRLRTLRYNAIDTPKQLMFMLSEAYQMCYEALSIGGGEIKSRILAHRKGLEYFDEPKKEQNELMKQKKIREQLRKEWAEAADLKKKEDAKNREEQRKEDARRQEEEQQKTAIPDDCPLPQTEPVPTKTTREAGPIEIAPAPSNPPSNSDPDNAPPIIPGPLPPANSIKSDLPDSAAEKSEPPKKDENPGIQVPGFIGNFV